MIKSAHTKNESVQRSVRFGWLDYWRMFLKRGIRLPFNYLLNAHLFDLIYKTDTHAWLPEAFYVKELPNFQNGALYMVSWSNEICRSYQTLLKNNHTNKNYVFIDIGCGKGKVCLFWKLLEQSHKKSVEIIGIDYCKDLISIAEQNHMKMFGTKGNFIHTDATEFNFQKIEMPIIAYLYNPFDEKILEKVVNNLPLNTIIVYNNPIYCQTLIRNGAKVMYHHFGWHPNVQTSIFIKHKSTQ